MRISKTHPGTHACSERVPDYPLFRHWIKLIPKCHSSGVQFLGWNVETREYTKMHRKLITLLLKGQTYLIAKAKSSISARYISVIKFG